MATYFVFSLFFLFCYFLLLPSATAELDHQYPEDCRKEKSSCGNLGEISLPFTTVNNTEECGGIYISGCDNNTSPKNIHLRNQSYKIDGISHMSNSIFIYGQSFYEFNSASFYNTRSFSLKAISFYACYPGYHSDEKLLKYRNCSDSDYDYDIYFDSKFDPPIFPLECLPFLYLSYGEPCRHLISSVEIKLDLDSSEDYSAGSHCLLNQETLNVTCFHGKYIILMLILLVLRDCMI
jgi:hypothetical protein